MIKAEIILFESTINLIKKTYGIRVKQLEEAIMQLNISTAKNKHMMSEVELKEKKEKLMELKGKLQDTFEEFLRSDPSWIPSIYYLQVLP